MKPTRPGPVSNSKRERVVTVLFSDYEKKVLTALAKKRGLRLSPWLRVLALNDLEKEE